MDALLGGGGFQPWNTVGGQTPNRPMVTSNTANAPLYQQNHDYVAGDRVIDGPGLSGGVLTSGSPVYLWAIQGSGGHSLSANGPQSCPSPANYGGGINGSPTPAQWSGATHVSDNGITWACLTQIDHITIHDMNLDAPAWQAGHLYSNSEWITTSGHAFTAGDPTWTTTKTCTSGGTPPPIGGGSDGTCIWTDRGAITYSPGNNYILHATSPIYGYVLGVQNTATENIWYGGHSKQTYANGASGEDHPIQPGFAFATTFITGSEIPIICPDLITNGSCGFTSSLVDNNGTSPYLVITTAPGDSAGETLGVTGGPLRYDPANGVAFTSSGSSTDGNNVAVALSQGGSLIFNGFQAYNPDNAAIGAGFDPPNTGTAAISGNLTRVIVKGAGSTAISLFAGDIINSLVIYTGTYPYGSAIAGKFPGNLYSDIVIGPGTSACPTCIAKQLEKPEYPTNQSCDTCVGIPYGHANVSNFQNTWMSGFANPVFYLTTTGAPLVAKFGPVTGSDNATDTPPGYVSLLFPNPPGGGPYMNSYEGGATFQWPGTSGNGCNGGPCQGLDPAAQFVHATIDGNEDFRLKSTSVLIGSGMGPVVFPPLSYTSIITAVDLAGQGRPTSGRYDIGPVQYNGTLAAPTITSPTTATGFVGTAFVYNIGATGAPTSYSASGLPSWASLNTSSGAITGIPDAAATTNATINATNGSGTGSGPLAITISPALVATVPGGALRLFH